jgi:hypothetical protein
MSSYINPETFDWPLAYDAESLLRKLILQFLDKNPFAGNLASRMSKETGTDFFEWVDYLTIRPSDLAEFQRLGFVLDDVDREVYAHPKAMLPRVRVPQGGSEEQVVLAIRPESLIDFAANHHLGGKIEGAFGSNLRQMLVADGDENKLVALERLAYRGYTTEAPTPGFVEALIRARELWRRRNRLYEDDSDSVAHAFEIQKEAVNLVGPDIACDTFFAQERVYWENRNRAARIQKRRQDALGLGWGNHDHHTFRCSRRFFWDLIKFLLNFGFEKRERYYAGAEAGWGAQILEHQKTGITVFADVDLMPEETKIDFSSQRLPEAPLVRTVGLWCGLHGDSFLQAGMHHLEARFDFSLLRDQLESDGVKSMKPFSDFDFLKQAFTEGEIWAVSGKRVEALLEKKMITEDQAANFKREGAVGSHLENLQRRAGFKGFNQKSVSAIIEATDPRTLQLVDA